jgi:FAD dependent oxidoreductase
MQAVSASFAIDHLAGEDHTIERPDGYERWKADRPPGRPEDRLSFLVPDPRTNEPVARTLRPNPPGDPAAIGPDLSDPTLDRDLWLFRRIVARGNFVAGAYRSDVTLVNWPQMDYFGDSIIGVPEEEAARHRRAARELSRCLLHWLQTEAPREDGGAGWPGLRLRGDILGDTPDGLAPALYVREARRIRGERTVVEQDGAHRLHPVEWNVGEAAGHLAAFCAARGTVPRAVRATTALLADFQHELADSGVELEWPDVRAYQPAVR